jgi:hypothetical protein
MKILGLALLLSTAFSLQSAIAQDAPAPSDALDREALYTASIERRTADIMNALDVSDPSKSNAVHNLIIAQYRLMRSRDAYFDAKLDAEGKDNSYANRAHLLQTDFKPLHDAFFARLSRTLTPAQIEVVKDKMTYDKVKVTLDAYVAIVPGLTEGDKAKVLELLKAAREEAVDGGSSHEKSDIFQKYKDQINAYLNAHGHDVAKAYKEWEASHPQMTNTAKAAAANVKPTDK